ncbi:MAG: DUF4423 domain-containing protein [Pseudobdellovibrio sp.]
MQLESTQAETLELNKRNQIETDLMFYTQSWVWRGVEALITAKDFDPSPISISKRINISTEAAVLALEGLDRLGLIQRQGTKIVKVENVTHFNSTNMRKTDLYKSHSNLAPQLLSKMTENSVFTTRFCLANYDLVKKHAPKIQSFLDSLDEEGSQLSSPNVMAVEITISDLSQKPQGGI